MIDRWGTDASGWRRDARLGLAAGTLLAGVVAAATGAASVVTDAAGATGVAPGVAHEFGLAVGGLVPFVVLLGVVWSLDSQRRAVGGVLVGTSLGVGGIAVGLLTGATVGDPVVTGLYAGGLGLAVVAMASRVVTTTGAAATGTDHTSVASSHTRTHGDDRALPSDGGRQDDDLSFPLDDE